MTVHVHSNKFPAENGPPKCPRDHRVRGEFEPEMGLRTFVRSAIAWELRFQLMQRPRLSHKIEIPHSNQLCNRFIPPSVQKTLPKIQTTLNQRKVGIEFQ